MASSFSRAGFNMDFLAASDPGDPHLRPYLYRDGDGRYVLLDVTGPGALTRMWMTQLAPETGQGDLTATGRIQIFFDEEDTPRIDLPATELFRGETPPFLSPLCGDHTASSGGNYCYVTMPFEHRIVLKATGRPNFWNFQYETYPEGTSVESFNPADAATLLEAEALADFWARSGTNPEILEPDTVHTGNATIEAGTAADLVDLTGAGSIASLEIAFDPVTDGVLRNLRLEAAWNGASTPQIDAPVSELFLTGVGERTPARGLLAGYRPAEHEGYAYFPIPFADGARIALRNEGQSPVTATWRVVRSKETYDPSRCGMLHATFVEDPATTNGDDVVLLDREGVAGQVVGISFTEEGPHEGLTVFLEGDERVYVDGAETPEIYGTGTEDIFNGGFYYNGGPFSRPTHGATAKEPAPAGAVVAQWRLFPTDPWRFRRAIRVGFEHGGGDGVPTSTRSVVWWYGIPEPAMIRTDTLDVGDGGSETIHAYESASMAPFVLTSHYDGDRDGNVSSFAQDAAIFPGAVPTGVDAKGEAVSDDGRYHSVGDTVRFNVSIDPENRGIVLRRRFDQIVFDQRAGVSIDGEPAGIWAYPIVNDLKRWRDHDFHVPGERTRGKSEITVTLDILPPVDSPPVAVSTRNLPTEGSAPTTRVLLKGGWTDFRYEVFSLATGNP